MGGSPSYYRHYEEPAKVLQKEVQKIIEKVVTVEKTKVIAVPFIVLGISKLTSTEEGRLIWSTICQFVNDLTNKVWVHKKKETQDAAYQITETMFCLPEGDVEALIHDMCHWIIATPEQREIPNLNLNPPYKDKDKSWLIMQEEMAWTLESWIFSAIIGEPELVELVNPNADIEVFHYWVRVFNPIDILMEALEKANEVKLNVTLLRRLLVNWIEWKKSNPAKDAKPRGCLGWGQIALPLPIANKIIHEEEFDAGYNASNEDILVTKSDLKKLELVSGVGFKKEKK